MFIKVRPEDWGNAELAINTHMIVSASEVLLRKTPDSKKRDYVGLQIKMADGSTHNIAEGLTMEDLF